MSIQVYEGDGIIRDKDCIVRFKLNWIDQWTYVANSDEDCYVSGCSLDENDAWPVTMVDAEFIVQHIPDDYYIEIINL